ncbi:hypothetical protein GQ44DRAFT_692794 [Phaeosphaeriaceae sp. PMI808]|nr:hypothetical protein GQ44DRAFT_692794 [Phaeosphaeriaceae sp. PMI808]
MNSSVSMSRWTQNEYNSNQSSSMHFTSELCQDAPIVTQDISLPTLNIRPSTLQPLEHRFSGDTVDIELEQYQDTGAVFGIIDVEDVITRIGSVLSNGKFICDNERCAGRTFARRADLKRHHTTLHAVNKPNFWCQVPSCSRSMSARGGAFHRKDKLMAHVWNMHH